MYYNMILISGFLTGDPEARKTQAGVPLTKARIANRAEDEQEATFLDVVAWRENGNILAKCKKGDMVLISGPIKSRKWRDRNGVDRTSYEIKAEFVAKDENVRKQPRQKINPMDYCPKVPGVNAPLQPPLAPAGNAEAYPMAQYGLPPSKDPDYDIPGDS